jgi:hypothetical protein
MSAKKLAFQIFGLRRNKSAFFNLPNLTHFLFTVFIYRLIYLF